MICFVLKTVFFVFMKKIKFRCDFYDIFSMGMYCNGA